MYKVYGICLFLLSLVSQGFASDTFVYDFDPSDQKKAAVKELYSLIAERHELQVFLHNPRSFEELCDIDERLRKNQLAIDREMRKTKIQAIRESAVALR